MPDFSDPLVRRLLPWQVSLLDSIEEYRSHRAGKPWTMVLIGDSTGHVRGLDARPQIFKIKLEPDVRAD